MHVLEELCSSTRSGPYGAVSTRLPSFRLYSLKRAKKVDTWCMCFNNGILERGTTACVDERYHGQGEEAAASAAEVPRILDAAHVIQQTAFALGIRKFFEYLNK